MLEQLRVSRPPITGFGVVNHRTVAASVIAHPSGPQVIAVRVGRSQQRAVICVADRERIGKRIVEWDILASKVRHGAGALLRDPLVVGSAIPRRMRPVPVVRRVLQEL